MKNNSSQSGNALIYVLIAIALFASLSFVLGRQTDTSEAGVVSDEQTELYAAQIMDYSAQVKSVIDQMMFSGSLIEDPAPIPATLQQRMITFFLPGDDNYDNGTNYRNIHMLFHPDGGGLSEKKIPEAVQAGNGSEADPPPGWYIGRFNNVEWTPSAATDIMLVAYKITRPVCEAINEKITGSSAIPALTGTARNFFIKEDASTPQHLDSSGTGHGGSANANLTVAACADCEGMPALCVSNNAQDVYAFYSLMVSR